MDEESTNKQVARIFFERLYSGGEIDLVDEIIAVDYVAHGPGSATGTTRNQAIRAEGREAVRSSISSKPADIEVVVEEQVAEGDRVVSRLIFRSGGLEWAGVAIQRFRDGMLTETWRITNRAG